MCMRPPSCDITTSADGVCRTIATFPSGYVYGVNSETELCISGKLTGAPGSFNNTMNWTCMGLNGGTNQGCSSAMPQTANSVDGVCAPNNLSAVVGGNVGQSILCSAGNVASYQANNQQGQTSATWSCMGQNDGQNVVCNGSVGSVQLPIDGVCNEVFGFPSNYVYRSSPDNILCRQG
jgi:hypothetical protein